MRWLIINALSLIMCLSLQGRAQSDKSIDISKLICDPPPLTRRVDSISNRVTIDSVYNLIAGRWHLLETHVDAYPSVQKPSNTVEIIIDSTGKGAIYVDNKFREDFIIAISIYYGYIRFNTNESGYKFFKFATIRKVNKDILVQPPGVIRICENILLIGGITSSGTQFYFQRQGN